MAKQRGLHQLRGKVGGYSYYKQKYVEGGLVRSIDENLSNRVKTAPEYENTRLNAEEFKCAAHDVGAILKAMPLKPRYVLNPFAQANLVKAVLPLIKQDASALWGRRNVPVSGFPNIVAAINKLTKNPLNALFDVETFIEDSTYKVALTAKPVLDYLNAIGASGVGVSVVFATHRMSTFDGTSYTIARSSSKEVSQNAMLPADFVNLSRKVLSTGISASVADSDSAMGLFYVVAVPARLVDDQTYILQQACAMQCFGRLEFTPPADTNP